jgi:ABC-type cobalt transport system substrate-binding protein
MKKRYLRHIIFALLVGILTNACGWAFNADVFAHELDHADHVHSLDPVAHHEAHQQAEAYGDDGLDAATHLLLHAAGQYQPFFFMPPLIVPASGAIEVLTVFVPATITDSILDSPLHPPRSILFA